MTIRLNPRDQLPLRNFVLTVDRTTELQIKCSCLVSLNWMILKKLVKTFTLALLLLYDLFTGGLLHLSQEGVCNIGDIGRLNKSTKHSLQSGQLV